MDNALVLRAQHGDATAFDRLVEVFSPLAWRTAIVLLGDRALAEDAVQEAWVDVWRALPTFRAEGTFRTWFLAIVANRCHKMTRHRTLPVVSLEHESPAISESLVAEQDTEAQALRRISDAEVRELLAMLTAEQRTILELALFADLTLAEIALITTTSLGTVKSRYHRALQTLRARLRPQKDIANIGGTS